VQFAHFTFDTETDRLGEGPLSEVYRAMDTRLGRRVALKILRGNAEIDPAADTRFLREAQHTSQLVHPNIATVFEYGRHNGTSFIAMELLLGRTLDRILKERPLSFEEGARVALDVAKALSLVHSHGLIHRDLKPANIMMLEDGSVKLLDFGIARARDESTITQNGILVGTVLYMSPEQVRGEDLDTRSDVFAFGSVFYHALTGVLPFPGKSFPEVCMAILDCKPRHPAQVRPDFPPKLQEFLLRCLSKDPSQRYADSQEIQRVLQGIVDGSRSLDAVTNTIEGTLLIPPVTCVGTDLEACSLMSGSLRKDLIGELKRVRGIEIVKIEDQELPRNVSFDYVLRMDLETQGEKGRLQIGLERWTDRIGGRRAAKPIEVAQDSLEDSDKNDFALQDKLVRLAVRTLKKRLSELTIRPATTTTRDVEKSQMLTRHAHEVLHRGTTKHLLSSISSFRSAIDADPNSALPHAGMAEALVRKYLYFDGDMSYIEEARVEAAHALARDPNCAEAHTSLASPSICWAAPTTRSASIGWRSSSITANGSPTACWARSTRGPETSRMPRRCCAARSPCTPPRSPPTTTSTACCSASTAMRSRCRSQTRASEPLRTISPASLTARKRACIWACCSRGWDRPTMRASRSRRPSNSLPKTATRPSTPRSCSPSCSTSPRRWRR
jgi:serine/threonine protein kinase